MIVSNKDFFAKNYTLFTRKWLRNPSLLISGGFEIFHEGHLEYLKKAEKYCYSEKLEDIDIEQVSFEPYSKLFIVLNGDEFIRRKHKREPIFPEKFRAKLLEKLCPNAYITIYNKRDDMVEILENGYWQIFGNGGDRKGAGLKPEEVEVCKRKKIKMVCLGKKKLNSTSEIVKRIQKMKVIR